ncbi:hypothetical protein J7399_12370 [Shimia sp. R9_1]|nr:hypothetical protein [Shimia sp. R9_1]MBO9408229.1 hypothetical protein [Shimia sp. R9_1]
MKRQFLPPLFLLIIFVLGGLSLASSPVFATDGSLACATSHDAMGL